MYLEIWVFEGIYDLWGRGIEIADFFSIQPIMEKIDTVEFVVISAPHIILTSF